MLTLVLLATTVFSPQATSTPLPHLDGVPVKLAWSRDNSQLYLATAASGARDAKVRHQFLITLPAGTVTTVDQPPEWVSAYWEWKSDRTSQHWPELTIDVVTSREDVQSGPMMTREALSTGTLGDGSGQGVVVATKHGAGKVDVYRLLLKGQVIAMTSGGPPNPGTTFSWVPGGDGPVMVFVDDKGRLSTLDKNGRRREIEDTKKATLPAVSWSITRVAFLQQTGRNDWSLRLIDLLQ